MKKMMMMAMVVMMMLVGCNGLNDVDASIVGETYMANAEVWHVGDDYITYLTEDGNCWDYEQNTDGLEIGDKFILEFDNMNTEDLRDDVIISEPTHFNW